MQKNLSRAERKRLEALVARERARPNWFKTSFTQQINFIEDKAPLKAALCTRRAGKSYGMGLYAYKTAAENPGVSVAVIGLTRASIQRIYFKDIMAQINREFGLRAESNKSELTWTLPNGSVIYFGGADSSEEEMQKLLGQKFKLVIIDESSMYSINLRELVYEILKPAVADYRGQICMIGTPGNRTKSLFYDVTTGKEPGWSVHKWNAFDNPHMTEQFKEEIEFFEKHNPLYKETAGFKQMYLGEWVVDPGARVYKYSGDRNAEVFRPTNQYHYVLGIDLGYDDATAFVLCAWSYEDPILHILKCEKESGLIISQVADKIRDYQHRYKVTTMVVDGADKQGIMELNIRHELPLIVAEKKGKRDFIEIMNDEFICKRIMVGPGAEALTEEWDSLIWDEEKKEKGVWEELKSCDNHAADAALYAWRWCYSYAFRPEAEPPKEDIAMWDKLAEETQAKDEWDWQ